MSYSKRDRLARSCELTGITHLAGLLPSRSGLVVLNYHRIGNPDESPYDAEVFSATAGEFEDQLRFLRKRFHIATLDEAVDFVESTRSPRSAVVLLTFDDGYVDNYQTAFPILSSYNTSAVFFLPTGFIGTNRIPWWDTVADIVNNSRRTRFNLNGEVFDIGAEGARSVIERVLATYKASLGGDSESLVAKLEDVCDALRPGPAERCFMTWEEAAAMVQGGMQVGSHTRSHEILSRLSSECQLEELVESKRELERRLQLGVYALSYPVGLPECFSDATRQAVRDAGYRLAFSFYGGANRAGSTDRYDVRRLCPASFAPRFRLQMTLGRASGKYWP